MPLTAGTLITMKDLVALICCPMCGNRSERNESLTSCGHYLCSDCVTKHVLSNDNKCPKCFANNYRNDCKEDLFFNNISKVANKVAKLVDKEEKAQRSAPKKCSAQTKVSSGQSKTCSAQSKAFLNDWPSTQLKNQFTKSSPNHKSTTNPKSSQRPKPSNLPKPSPLTKPAPKPRSTAPQKFVSKPSYGMEKPKKIPRRMPKPLVESKEIREPDKANLSDMDLESIPDSLDGDRKDSSHKSERGHNKAVNILDKLGDYDHISVDMESENGSSKKLAVNTSDEENEDIIETSNKNGSKGRQTNQKSKNFAEKGVQMTPKEPPKAVLHSVSVQCSAIRKSIGTQTDQQETQVANKTSDGCYQSGECDFLKTLETTSCEPMKALFRALMTPKITENAVVAVPSVSQPSVISEKSSSEQEKTIVIKEDVPQEKMAENKEKTQSSVVSESSEVMIIKKPSQRRPKRLNYQSSDDEVEEFAKEKVPKQKSEAIVIKPVFNDQQRQTRTRGKKNEGKGREEEAEKEDVTKVKEVKQTIQIDSSGDSKEVKDQSSVSNSALKRGKVDKETKANKKRYVSSDEEEEEESEEDKDDDEDEESEEEIKEVVKNKGPKGRGRGGRRSIEKPQTSSDSPVSVSNVRVSGLRRGTAIDKKRQMIEEAKGPKGNASESEDKPKNDQMKEIVEKNERSTRGSVPKKRFAIEGTDDDEKDEPQAKRASKVTESSTKPKPKYKPRPKSKQTQKVDEEVEEEVTKVDDKPKRGRKPSNNEVFKLPPPKSPSGSEVSSSSSSRARTSSSERLISQKKVILYSGLNDQQKRKIEALCHELDAETVSDWTDRVTHLVICLSDERPKKEMICPRNAKYLKALLANKWIVSFEWITDSHKCNRWADEAKYEIQADKSAFNKGVPNQSRTTGQKLFHKQMFQFIGDFGQLLDEMVQMVQCGGGIVIESEDEYDRRKKKEVIKKLIRVAPSTGMPDTQVQGIKYVSKNVFMQAISNFTPL